MTNDLTLLGETRVALAGDWHGDTSWVSKAIPYLARAMPGVRTILHAGDFGFWGGSGFLKTVDYWCERAGLQRVMVTPGNHEDWPALVEAFSRNFGQPVQLSAAVWMMPRGFRFTLAGRSFMSFGGAASLDYADRTSGRDWFYEEVATDSEVDAAIAGGPVQTLLLHETVDGGTPLVQRIINANPMGWNSEELAYSAASRARVTRLAVAVSPEIVVHGHIHVKDEAVRVTGTRIYSLNCEDGTGNLASLDLLSGDWEWLGDPRRR
ncbi:metallophosphoesterase [Cryobacterium sp. TMT1-66-1]|uniref:metallophosphoesterase family protein n=1 Tax=Cryobacterium sp. TMT1-66-1 TaxID=1259242 RepID=UPI001069C7DC|nr:metallophosphoesterase [Cryobacterium sp. TMT1-66-1]TFD04163.1 metallophosphoesterase [Cryobacterium sp. TMT1-66-1]